ncbi:MAG: nuclear transport factor 2 family protein [Xanthomonadales bacterium]|nr:nuclear transport factor 2 family protein [Xanthomonadales bacterium]
MTARSLPSRPAARFANAGRIAAAVLLAVLAAACGEEPTIEQQVIATIREMERHIEAGERRPFMDYVAEEFSGQHGSLNRDQLRALMIMQLNRYQRLQGQLFPIRVEETGEDTATAHFRALVTGGPNWWPESGQVFDFETHWRRIDGDWRLTAADWDHDPEIWSQFDRG